MATSWLNDLQERVDIIRHKLKFIDNKPSIACIEWLDPLMVSGNWVPQLVSIAGGSSILAEAGQTFHLCAVGRYQAAGSRSDRGDALWISHRKDFSGD